MIWLPVTSLDTEVFGFVIIFHGSLNVRQKCFFIKITPLAPLGRGEPREAVKNFFKKYRVIPQGRALDPFWGKLCLFNSRCRASGYLSYIGVACSVMKNFASLKFLQFSLR